MVWAALGSVRAGQAGACLWSKPGARTCHSGEFLREALVELAITQSAFAQAIGLSVMRVSHVLKRDRAFTAELALRLGRALGQTPQYWLNLQTTYDLKITQIEKRDSLKQVQVLGAT
jgi:addiction module HigA family antidote